MMGIIKMTFVDHSQIQKSYKTLTTTITRTFQENLTSHTTLRSTTLKKDMSFFNVLEDTPNQLTNTKGNRPSLKQSLLAPFKSKNTQQQISNPYRSTSIRPPQCVMNEPGSPCVMPTIASRHVLDDKWVGNRLMKPKSSFARIWVQNVHGLDISNNFNPYLEHLDYLKRYNISFLALTETHLNHRHLYVKENLEASHRIAYPEGHVQFTNTPDITNANTRQSGGVLSSVQGNLSSRFAGSGSDDGGRYVWMDFYGKEIFLRVYVVYRVCANNDAGAGDKQAWTLQREWLLCKGVDTNPRLQILRDLKRSIQRDIDRKRQILLVGDFNENMLGTKGDTIRMMSEIGLVNVLETNLSAPAGTRSYCRGSTIIDGVWATPYVQQKIISFGLAPFDFLYTSDHRGLFIDIDILDILDARDVHVQLPAYRRLKCTIPKRVQSYCENVRAKWANHKIKEKIDELENMSQYLNDKNIYNAFIKFLNKYDDEIGGILTSSERKCCQVGRHCTLQFTPELKKLLRNRRQLQQQISKKQKLNLMDQASGHMADLKQMRASLHQQNLDLREYKKNQRTKREEYLNERAQDIVHKRDLPKSKVCSIMKNLKHIERQIYDAARIRHTLKPGTKSRTDFVMIPALSQYTSEQKSMKTFNFMDIETIWPRLQVANGKDITEWYDVENPELVEDLILKALQKHFSQASNMLITSQKWRKILSSKEGQEQLLNGTFDWGDDVPDEFQDLLSTFKSNGSKPKSIPFQLKYESFVKFIQYSKEKTSTSPSSRHYGHYKALLDQAPDALHDIFRLMKLSVDNGIFLKRYEKTLTTLICKEVGTPYLHRFRPIHIIEAELQFISKSIWAKKMIKAAELNGQITDAQYGGRAGRQAQSSVMNTVLYYDIHRQLRKDFTSNDDDMKANFDREIPHYVAAETRSIGMPFEAGDFLLKATASQKYYIRTSNGPSSQHYSFNSETPIWGLGQGVGWAGACWQITASTISKCMNNACLGITLCCPSGKITVKKLMDFFIDDTKKVCNQMREGMTLREQTEFNMQKHTYYIASTGGSLALDKCTWYHITFSFDENGNPIILNKTQMPGEIEVYTDFNGTKVRIKRLEYNVAHKTLGYFVSPDGISDAHFNFTKTLVKTWVARVKSSRLTSLQILKSYETVLKRQLVYRMVATSFTYQQCDTLVRQINPILLNAAGLQRNFPRSIMEAGEEYAGFNWPHLYDIHGQEKLQFFMMHLRKQDTTGHLLNICMQYTQLQLGVEMPFFSLDYDEYFHLCQPTWITHLWEYTSSRGLDVSLTDAIVLPKTSSSDRFIMDILIESSALSTSECAIANKVRIAMQILHLSDVVDGRGRRLLPEVRNAKICRKSTLTWPKQILLKRWMSIWHKACSILQRYVSKYSISDLHPTTHQNQIWEWSTSPTAEWVTDGRKKYYKKHLKNRSIYIRNDKIPIPEESCRIPCDITFSKGRPRVIHLYHSLHRNPNTESNDSMNTPIPMTNDWSTRIFGKFVLKNKDVEKDIIHHINNGSILVGLDGSVTLGKGAYSFGFFRADSTPLYLHHGPVHGDIDQQNSTRSEMHGILGAVLFLNELIDKYSINPKNIQTITVYGDNLASLRTAREGPSYSLKNVFSSDMDVAFELYHCIKKSGLSFDFIHVKSHQDNNVNYQDLSIDAKINVQCDQYVTKYYREPMSNCVPHMTKIPHYPSQKISISNLYTRLTTSYRSNIHKYKIGHEAENQCSKTWRIPKASLKYIDWENLRKEIKSKRGFKRFRLSKAIHRQWPTMDREHKWKRAPNDLCPMCTQEKETILHIFCCKHDMIRLNRVQAITKFKDTLKRSKTSPILTNHLHRVIQQFCGGYKISEISLPDGLNENHILRPISEAFRFQSKHLGYLNMMFGVVTPLFSNVQEQYYKHNSFGRNFTSDRWGRWFIQALLEVTMDIWTFRCNTLHDRSNGTMENRLRCLASDWLTQLRTRPTLIPLDHRYILNRSVRSFQNGNIGSVHAWIRRMEKALKEARTESNTSDIRKWLIAKHDKIINIVETPNGVQVPQESHSERDDLSECSTISLDVDNRSFGGLSTEAIRDLFTDLDSISTGPLRPRRKYSFKQTFPCQEICVTSTAQKKN